MIIVIRKDLPERDGEAVLLRGDSSSPGRWVTNCKGGKYDVRAGGMMRIPSQTDEGGKYLRYIDD